MPIRLDIILFIAVLALAIVIGGILSLGDGENDNAQSSVSDPTAFAAASDLLPGDVDRGKATAERLCKACHGLPPSDTSPLTEAPLFAEVASRWSVDNLAEALAKGVVDSHDDYVELHRDSFVMPDFIFDPQEIEDLLAYMSSIAE